MINLSNIARQTAAALGALALTVSLLVGSFATAPQVTAMGAVLA